jgi:ribonuclease HI
MEPVRLFTDGACSKNGYATAAAAYAFWFPEKHKALSHAAVVPKGDKQSNQRAELMAIAEGVRVLAENSTPANIDLTIYTDSLYSKKCLTEWLPKWIKSDWKTSTRGDVLHKDLIKATSDRLKLFGSFTITHVFAHTCNTDDISVNNAIVDKMATGVLNPPPAETPVIQKNDDVAIEGLPLRLMGPPINELDLGNWCVRNIDKLDKHEVTLALIHALSRTVGKNGFKIEKSRYRITNTYQLVSANKLIIGTPTKDEE